MKRVLFVAAAVVAALSCLWGEPATAQVTRTFVSGFGSDSNPCSLGAPCRSFQQAHDTVAAGGEIVALDAAGYGTLNIAKAVTVTAIGVDASITTMSSGITINAGPSDMVTIRGLSLFFGGNFSFPPQQADGIAINSAKSVAIRDCWISGFPRNGINIDPSASLDVELRNVTADNNGSTGPYRAPGLLIDPTGSGTVTALVTDSFFVGNTQEGIAIVGYNSTGIIKVTLSVVAKSNFYEGIVVTSDPGKATPVVMVTDSKIANNNIGGAGGAGGLSSSNGARVFVDRTQITGNKGNGWGAFNGGAMTSYTNNEVGGNDSDGLNGVVQISPE
jgi:hypothetical protein